jgi:hypothetical protein
MTPELTKAQEFWLSLEAERFNVAYRTSLPERIREVPVYREKPCTRKHVNRADQQKRDQVMFHAGRYAAGATDKAALDAHKALDDLLGGN